MVWSEGGLRVRAKFARIGVIDSSVVSLLQMGPEPPSIHDEFLADGAALDRRNRLRVAYFEAGAAAVREFVAAAFRLPLMPNVLAHFFHCL